MGEKLRQLAEKMRNPFVVDAAFLEKVKNIYLQRCASCHLEDGSAPNYHLPPLSMRGTTPRATTYGVPSSIMKGYQKELTLEERWQVVAYMRRELAGARE